MDKLREALVLNLKATAKESFSLNELEEFYKKDSSKSVAAFVLKLKKPSDGIELLKKILHSKNKLAALEAACVLALLGSRDGLEQLKTVQTLTNSQVEFFYAKAALIILHEPIPANLKNMRSVFQDLEEMIHECSK